EVCDPKTSACPTGTKPFWSHTRPVPRFTSARPPKAAKPPLPRSPNPPPDQLTCPEPVPTVRLNVGGEPFEPGSSSTPPRNATTVLVEGSDTFAPKPVGTARRVPSLIAKVVSRGKLFDPEGTVSDSRPGPVL